MYITVRMYHAEARGDLPRRPPASRPVATIVFIVLYCTLYIINVYVGTLQFCTVRAGPRRAARGATHIIPHIRDLCTESTPWKECPRD